MLRHVLVCTALALSSGAFAACPEYLDGSMRKLHSQDQVNLCETQAGKPMLIVNTASHCGYTPQFKGLEALHQKYGKQGLVVIGFASNDFRQEAKDEASAADVCYVNYGVTFTMIAPSHVKGAEANPVFRALAEQSQAPGWNFNKYLVDASGNVVKHFDGGTTPDSKMMQVAIESVL
ncbi:MAG: glutathione peroxidase [Halioglobus sp.]